jgi:hypothetical protein
LASNPGEEHRNRPSGESGDVENYGTTKLYAALTLMKEDPEMTFRELHVTVTRKGKEQKVSLEDATILELRDAIRSAAQRKPKKPKSETAVAVLKALSNAKVKGVTVDVSRSGVITVSGFTAETMETVGKVLSNVRVPRESELRPVA